jgi:flagellar biosynthesis/type III secretory pathway protein FliH
MQGTRKPPEKLRTIPRATTLRLGSYRLVTDPMQTVVIKSPEITAKKPADLNETDWFYQMLDAIWDKAEAAYYQGLEEGFKLGLERGQGEAQAVAVNFRRTLETLDASLLEFFNGVEHWSVKLSMNIAEKVIGKAAEQHRDLVQQTVRLALHETADKTRLLVKVNPSDYEILKTLRSELTALSEGIEHFKIEADNAITPGSCRVETASGLLDADFTTQLQELRRALMVPEEVSP